MHVKAPTFPIEDIEDCYTYYVLIMKIPDSLFRESNLFFLDKVVEDKIAYDNWYGYAMRREGEIRNGSKK